LSQNLHSVEFEANPIEKTPGYEDQNSDAGRREV
jgi:hypothetical protein